MEKADHDKKIRVETNMIGKNVQVRVEHNHAPPTPYEVMGNHNNIRKPYLQSPERVRQLVRIVSLLSHCMVQSDPDGRVDRVRE